MNSRGLLGITEASGKTESRGSFWEVLVPLQRKPKSCGSVCVWAWCWCLSHADRPPSDQGLMAWPGKGGIQSHHSLNCCKWCTDTADVFCMLLVKGCGLHPSAWCLEKVFESHSGWVSRQNEKPVVVWAAGCPAGNKEWRFYYPLEIIPVLLWQWGTDVHRGLNLTGRIWAEEWNNLPYLSRRAWQQESGNQLSGSLGQCDSSWDVCFFCWFGFLRTYS